MSIEMLTLLLIISMFVLFVTGLPIAFGLSAVAIILGFFFWGPQGSTPLCSDGIYIGTLGYS